MSIRICICGKILDDGEHYCSERCKFIFEKLRTPLGSNMDLNRAIRFFGDKYDRGDR